MVSRGRRAPRLTRHGERCTTCSRAGRASSRTATSTPRPCRSPGRRDLEPDKTSIREALGRALFRSQRYEQAAAEFEAVVDRAPTNDFALFCLGRSLQLLGRHQEARHPLALAANLRPERGDYRKYRDQARARGLRAARQRGRSTPLRSDTREYHHAMASDPAI